MPRQYDFPVILQDVDYMSKIKLVSFTDKILSAAGMDADRLGFGVGDLNIENCTWVLSRFAVQTQTMPRVGDRLSISTWINQYGRVLTTRNFIITNQNGAEIAKAITLWAMLDIKRRTPVDLSHIEEALRHTEPEPSPIEQPMRIKTTGLPVLAKHNVAYSDIDFNGHVGTMRYLEMMMDALPKQAIEKMEKIRLDVNFLHETSWGKTIEIGYDGREGEHSFGLTVEGEDICRAVLIIS